MSENIKPTVSADDIARVKALGFLYNKNTPDLFNGRVITKSGRITADESIAIAKAAKKFGNGNILMTTRLTVELQGVKYENIEPMREYLAQYGLETGGTGAKVRPIVSCKGTTCKFGLIDTSDLGEEIQRRFFKGYEDVKLPHKFKIAVGGCPNNCVKPDLNDLGIIGQRVPTVNVDKCRGCRICQIEKACPIKASKLVDGKVVRNEEECNNCGRCFGKCPFKAFDNYTDGYKIYIGGRWGKRFAKGNALSRIFTDREEVLNVVERAIQLFRDEGEKGERFADTIARLGFDNVEKRLLAES